MAAEPEPATLCIEDPLAAKVGLKSTWGIGNQLFAFAGEDSTKNQSGLAEGLPVIIHEITWNTDMHGPITRKLVNESHDIFKELQSQEMEVADSTRKPQLIKFSRRYRSVLKATIMELQTARESSIDESNQQQFHSQVQMFQMVELVWSLCEILFIEMLPGGIILGQLLDWLRWHFTRADELTHEVLQEDAPESSTFYWDSIYCCVLQGRIDDARKLLAVHSQYGSDSFQNLDELLKKMPMFSRYQGHTLAEFDIKWRHWQEECIRRLDEEEFCHQKHLETVCRILCGDDDAFLGLRDLCESWYHMLISKLLYTNPTVKTFDLQHHAQSCIDAFGGNTQLETLDSILLAAIEFDVHQVIKESSSHMSNWWFSAHLTDLLQHAAQFELHKLNFGSDLREFLLLEYASGLMSHESLWQVGASYLDHCVVFGRQYLECFIERIPIQTEKKAQKMLRMCQQREMPEQCRSICKVMGMRAFHNGKLGNALAWCLKSKDLPFATYISEKFLSEYLDRGDFSNTDIIDSLGPAMLLSDRLTFLGKYREFYKLHEEKDYKAAGSLLLSLITAKLAPKRFWLTLLTDCLPLLEIDDQIIFSSQQTYELMHCLEDLCLSEKHVSESGEKGGETTLVQNESNKENINFLRLALAQNLARSIVAEGGLLSL